MGQRTCRTPAFPRADSSIPSEDKKYDFGHSHSSHKRNFSRAAPSHQRKHCPRLIYLGVGASGEEWREGEWWVSALAVLVVWSVAGENPFLSWVLRKYLHDCGRVGGRGSEGDWEVSRQGTQFLPTLLSRKSIHSWGSSFHFLEHFPTPEMLKLHFPSLCLHVWASTCGVRKLQDTGHALEK